jgi:hypothetical protein
MYIVQFPDFYLYNFDDFNIDSVPTKQRVNSTFLILTNLGEFKIVKKIARSDEINGGTAGGALFGHV